MRANFHAMASDSSVMTVKCQIQDLNFLRGKKYVICEQFEHSITPLYASPLTSNYSIQTPVTRDGFRPKDWEGNVVFCPLCY